MKKLALVLVLVLVFALPVFANPFVDVPLDHWAYDSVQSLAAKGIIVGYPDGTFGGENPLTRYEFAEATVKALAYVEGMDFAAAEDVAILEKLAIEFADELASLGVTVADLEAALGENSVAIAALKVTVDKLDKYFEPVVITGDFTASYEKVVVPMATATLTDETNINILATINDVTTAGISIEAVGLFAGAPVATWNSFFVDYQGADFQLRVGEVEPDTIGLGLVFDSDDFDGFLATWVWDTENDLGDWTLFGDIEDYYTANIGFALGGEDEVAVGVTGSYDLSAAGYAGGADVAFNLGDEDEVGVIVEGAAFYGTALSYAGATKVSGALDDLDLTVKAYYVLPGFVPTMSDFDPDRLGGYVQAKYPLVDEVTGKVKYTYEMDSVMAGVETNKVRGTLNYIPEDAAEDEEGEAYVEYDVIGVTTKGRVKYLNYPLADDFVLSGLGQYTYPTANYVGVATLVYDLAEDMDLTAEGRVDSDGAAFWSAEVGLAYALAEKTTLSVGFEMNDWLDDINDYGDLTIDDTFGTVKVELKVKF